MDQENEDYNNGGRKENMIYFRESYISEAYKIIDELREFSDTRDDLQKIEGMKQRIKIAIYSRASVSEMNNVLQHAKNLNDELNRKYPIIQQMLQCANGLKRTHSTNSMDTSDNIPDAYKMLEQDRCGILCHTLLKKGITNTIEETIEHVE